MVVFCGTILGAVYSDSFVVGSFFSRFAYQSSDSERTWR